MAMNSNKLAKNSDASKQSKPNLKISKKSNNVNKKQVVIDTSILDAKAEKKQKRTIAHKKDLAPIVSINELKKQKDEQVKKHRKISNVKKLIENDNENIEENRIVKTKKTNGKRNLHLNLSQPPTKQDELCSPDIQEVLPESFSPDIDETIITNDSFEKNDINYDDDQLIDTFCATKRNLTINKQFTHNFSVSNNNSYNTLSNREKSVNFVKEKQVINSPISTQQKNDNNGYSTNVEIVKLPIEKRKKEKKEVTINQNSAFFSEPSIFKKFNILVVKATEEQIEMQIEEESKSDVNLEKVNIDTDKISENTTNNNYNIESITQDLNKEKISDIINKNNTDENDITFSLNDLVTSSDSINSNTEVSNSTYKQFFGNDNELNSIDTNSILNNYSYSQIEDLLSDLSDLSSLNNYYNELSEKATQLSNKTSITNDSSNNSNEPELIEYEPTDSEINNMIEEIPNETNTTLENNQDNSSYDEYDFVSYEVNNYLDNQEDLEETPEENSITDSINTTFKEEQEEFDIFSSLNDDNNKNNDIKDSNIAINDTNISDLITIDDILDNKDLSSIVEDSIKDDSDELMQAAESLSFNNKIDDNTEPLGNFFESSTPSINLNNNFNKQIKKSFKNSLFSNIFKKFSFEEPEMINLEKQNSDSVDQEGEFNTDNVISSPIINNNSAQVSNSNIDLKQENADLNNISNIDVTASTSAVIELPTIENINSISTDNKNSSNDLYSNIITPESHANSDDLDINLDDINLDDLEINLNDLSEIENNVENDITTKTQESNNEPSLIDLSQESHANLDDLDINLNDINLDDLEINLDDLSEIENNAESDITTETPESKNEPSFIELLQESSISDTDNEIKNEEPILNDESDNNNNNNDEFLKIDNLSDEELDKEIEKFLQEQSSTKDNKDNDDDFSVEKYFGIHYSQEENEDSFNTYEEDNEEEKTVNKDKVDDDNELLEDNQDEINAHSSFPTPTFISTNFENGFFKQNAELIASNISENISKSQISSFEKLIETFNQTISTLSNRIADLNTPINSDLLNEENKIIEIESKTKDVETKENEVIDKSEKPTINNQELKTDLADINLEDLDISSIDLEDIEKVENTIPSTPIDEIHDISLDDITLEDLADFKKESETQEIENILSKKFSDDNLSINNQMKQDLLTELSQDEESSLFDDLSNSIVPDSNEVTSDFFKIIDSLTKTITALENTPDSQTTTENISESEEIIKSAPIIEEPISIKEDVKQEVKGTIYEPLPEKTVENISESLESSSSQSEAEDKGKAINILINEDDIFSISIMNETYEIVADFGGISVLSENLHISTPKNNFFVKVGNHYIEIHNNKDHFLVYTSFEDIEFANAINNVTFAKKNNKIELNIKEAFKISSVNSKIELSMLNTSIANLSQSSETTNTNDDSSVCDNKTLVISEETQKVYLPYTIEEVMKKLNNSSEYQTIEDVVEKEYTLPLSTFKNPIISRFKEAFKFMREKEKSSLYAALDLAVELMFNSELNPAVIRACKDLKELNIYLDCLYENEIDKFNCFKIIYKVLPKIQ